MCQNFTLCFPKATDKEMKNEGGLVQVISESSVRKTETIIAISTEKT